MATHTTSTKPRITRKRFLRECLVLPGVLFAATLLFTFGAWGGAFWWVFLAILGLFSGWLWGILFWKFFLGPRLARLAEREFGE